MQLLPHFRGKTESPDAMLSRAESHDCKLCSAVSDYVYAEIEKKLNRLFISLVLALPLIYCNDLPWLEGDQSMTYRIFPILILNYD